MNHEALTELNDNKHVVFVRLFNIVPVPGCVVVGTNVPQWPARQR